MLQGTLYILAGASLYAATRRLYDHIKLRRGPADVLYTILFILLAACSAAGAAAMSASASNTAATISILSGTLLWGLLPWTTASLVRIRPGLPIDILTAGWITVLIGQLSYPQQHNAYWSGLSWLVLLSLAHSAIITVQHLWPACKTALARYLFGLSLLALGSLGGFFFGILIFPFGFLLFLLLAVNLSLPHSSTRAVAALAHIPATPIDVTFGPWSGTQKPASVSSPACAATNHQAPSSDSQHPLPESRPAVHPDESELTARPRLNGNHNGLLISIADELMDITVYATMALNRIQTDKSDPKSLTALLRRIRSRAINSHRDANRLSQPHGSEYYRNPERTD